MNDRQLETALAYLNEQSGRYSLEALRKELLRTGYDPATVDQAIQTFQASGPQATRSFSSNTSNASNARSCGLALLIGLLLCAILGLLVFGLCVHGMRNV